MSRPRRLQTDRSALPLPHCFSTPGGGPMSLWAYLFDRHADFSFGHAPWELAKDELPEVLTAANFWQIIPPRRIDLRHASAELCARLILFAVHFIEQVAVQLPVATGEEPTPAEILDGIVALARRQSRVVGHMAWMYAKAVEHPVVAAAVHNALHHRWGFTRNPRAARPSASLDEDPYAEPVRVRVPFPLPEDAARHQHTRFPPGPAWPASSLTWSLPAVASSAEGENLELPSSAHHTNEPIRVIPSGTHPACPAATPAALRLSGNCATGKAEAPRPAKVTRSPRNLVPPLPCSERFVTALQAAYQAAQGVVHPQAWLLEKLRLRFNGTASSSTPAPRTPQEEPLTAGLWVLAQALFGPGRSRWEAAEAAFLQSYTHWTAGTADCPGWEVESAQLRLQAFVCLVEGKEASRVEGRWQNLAAGARPRGHALASAAASAPLRALRSRQRTGRQSHGFDLASLFTLADQLTQASPPGELEQGEAPGGPAISAREPWWLDAGLLEAQAGFSALAQQFLVYTLTLLEPDGQEPSAGLYTVQAEEFAAWAQREVGAVRQAFAGSTPEGSPDREIASHVLALPLGQERGGGAKSRVVFTRWFDGLALAGEVKDAGGSLRVGFSRGLLPYLRRLCQCYYEAFEP